jgi:hypothetical protein
MYKDNSAFTNILLNKGEYLVDDSLRTYLTPTGFTLTVETLAKHNVGISQWALQRILEQRGRTKPLKALANYVYKQLKISLSPEALKDLSNVMSQWNRKVMRVTDDFIDINVTQDLDWDHGTFGDSGSCWFNTDHEYARSEVVGNGGFALTSYKKYSRCWVLPLDTFVVRNGCRPALEPAYVLFNAYGSDLTMFVEHFITILSTETKSKFESLSFDFQINYTDMSCNSGMFLVFDGQHKKIANRIVNKVLDLRNKRDNISQIFYPQDTTCCDNCGEYVNEDYAIWALDQLWCDDCANEELFHCAGCYEYYDRKDVHEHVNGDEYCETCAQDYSWCEDCGKLSDEMYCAEDTGSWYCKDCIDTNAEKCEKCGDYNERDYVEVHQGVHVCEMCQEEHVMVCPVCYDTILTEDAALDSDGETYVCEGCVSEEEPEFA